MTPSTDSIPELLIEKRTQTAACPTVKFHDVLKKDEAKFETLEEIRRSNLCDRINCVIFNMCTISTGLRPMSYLYGCVV